MIEKDIKSIITDFVDFLLPELTPYETSLYLFILRNSVLKDGSPKMRIGKRTMAQGYGTGKWGAKTSFAHMTKLVASLEEKRCLSVGDTTREGTEYTIKLPRDIPLVQNKLAAIQPPQKEEDYFTDPQKRTFIFERDNWICQYCGEKVTKENATLDHYIPQSKDGKNTKENLRTCCLVCNSIKSGKSFEEAAPHILKNIQEIGKRKNR
jgi:5-methylcytosine-specific restriction endonuclease McrA